MRDGEVDFNAETPRRKDAEFGPRARISTRRRRDAETQSSDGELDFNAETQRRGDAEFGQRESGSAPLNLRASAFFSRRPGLSASKGGELDFNAETPRRRDAEFGQRESGSAPLDLRASALHIGSTHPPRTAQRTR